ncbi:hypothetical protein LXL04_034324 [Taraxacum kok-saghyz]
MCQTPPAFVKLSNANCFPDGTKKEELSKTFGNFGRVADIYLGGRKDYQKKNSAFVRFAGVEDAKALEEKLQGIKCKEVVLAVNIAKHQRRQVPPSSRTLPPRPGSSHAKTSAPIKLGSTHQFTPNYMGGRVTRSYAHTLTGVRVEATTPCAPPIKLNLCTHMSEFLKKRILIGEAHSLDHIGTMHATQIMNSETKYLGGLRIAIEFDSSTKATQFMEDRSRWLDWFKRITRADQINLEFERMAWLKILGVPLDLWDKNNFFIIASKYGRVINPFDNIDSRRDNSMGKVGVLTSSRRWINEEITISANWNMFWIGVVEYTDDWSPFKPVPFDKVEESDAE